MKLNFIKISGLLLNKSSSRASLFKCFIPFYLTFINTLHSLQNSFVDRVACIWKLIWIMIMEAKCILHVLRKHDEKTTWISHRLHEGDWIELISFSDRHHSYNTQCIYLKKKKIPLFLEAVIIPGKVPTLPRKYGTSCRLSYV